MTTTTAPSLSGTVWRLARRQHDMVARSQLLALGLSDAAIRHRIVKGRLHPKFRGVYAVGSPHITRRGWWTGAVLRCGSLAVLSDDSAGELMAIVSGHVWPIHVSVPRSACPRCSSIRIHRRSDLIPEDVTIVDGIPVTTPARTLLDLAARLSSVELEACVNAADKLEFIDPEELRSYVAARRGAPGAGALRELLDRRTFRLTDSELERRFLRLVRSAGLPMPRTGKRVNGFKVDFFWPELGLVVETDGLRYHRTAAQQTRDHRRDQAHIATGLTALRFTHAQVHFEAASVIATLRAVSVRLGKRTMTPLWTLSPP